MNIYYCLLFSLLFINSIFSQIKTCNCVDELNNVSQLIKNAKSYKVEIKGKEKLAEFKTWKNHIKHEIETDTLSPYFCVGYLLKYISFINDRHNEIYTVPEDIATSVPNYVKIIDTTNVSKDGISGIYYAGKDKILLTKENDSIWFGIILSSNAKAWTKGKIKLRLKKKKNKTFELFEYFKNGILFYKKNIKIENGRIHSTFWNTKNKYFFNKNHYNNFNYKSINTNFDYIGIKTLKRTNPNIKEAKSFYSELVNKLKANNLIIDLRNNGGGSTEQIKPLVKLIEKQKHIQLIFVIINFKTGSAAELGTILLKKDKRTVIVGENSRGILTYGNGNKSYSTKTNCYGYNVSLTTKLTSIKFSPLEFKGIAPDVYLNNNSDWIEQILILN